MAIIHSSGIKPHVCAVCGHAFVEKHNLKQHERTHMKGNKEEGGSSHIKYAYLDTYILPMSCQVIDK